MKKKEEKIIKLTNPKKVLHFLKEYQKLCKKYDLQIHAGSSGDVFVSEELSIDEEVDYMFKDYVSHVAHILNEYGPERIENYDNKS